ncbi:type III effector HrpK domain-containing protein [Pseudomonas psychrophila]|uniref:type III effector HrpK domain-containing protein n=1 Tax=Pseudomonas psychrophila TaxID=122355 RepID=UPI0002F89AB2|nr:type III effector HrpK domain-containing protein [Pseudomonas psychrophila]
MRISSSPLSGNGSAVSGAEPQAAPASQDPKEAPATGNIVQFGVVSRPLTFMDQVNKQMDDAQAGMDKLEKEIESNASSLKDQFDQLMSRLFNPTASPTAAPADAPAPASAAAPVTPVAAPAASPADPAATPVPAASADGAFLDDSKYSSPQALKKWAPMVANLPADQQLQAEKELNRPIAAAQMAQEGGANGAQAMAFINANPALKNAIDTAINPKADGIINNKDLSRFVSQSQSAADAGDKDLADYRKSNPNADAQSLQMVTSAALMRANSYLTVAADPAHSAGASQQTNVNGLTDQAGLAALQNSNPGLSGALRQAAKTWSQPGFFNQLDQGGLSGRALAAHSPDGLFNSGNIDSWIKKQAPTNGGEFASMLSDAATINAVSSTDISKLGTDVFDHPQNYTGAQKAAVMVKLQQTKQSVDAGSDLRKTGDTEAALAEKIGQLQSDPDVQAYLQQAVPSQERALVASDPALKTAVYDQMQKVNNGQALRNDMSTAEKNQGKGAAAPDYSGALNGLSAQLQLQRDLLGPNVKVPTAQQVVGNQPAVQKTLQDAYQANFTNGGELHQLLGQKKADASQALQRVEVQKSAYEDVLPDDFLQRQQANVEHSTANELVQSKAGRSFLDKVANGDSGATAVLAMTATQKAQQVKDTYDDTKDSISGLKDGVDVVRKLAGREASAGLGRLAAGAAIRIGAAVGAEAAGAAVASTIGVAAGPVGWAVDAVLSLGLGIAAIIAAVQKHAAAKHFDHNVDPTLDQFGIPRPH